MTDEQLTKSRRVAERDGFTNVRFEHGYIEQAPVDDESADVVISNGVINLWASCIGGAMQEDDYRGAIEDAVLELRTVQDNSHYHFISDSARGATETSGVKSVSALAVKPA